MCFSTNHDLQNNSQDLLLGAPNALKPGMPVMRFLGSKSLTLGLMVRAFTSVTPAEARDRLKTLLAPNRVGVCASEKQLVLGWVLIICDWL